MQPTKLSVLKRGDWVGIGAMAIGLGSLEIVLEDGNRKDWFGDPVILRLACVALLFIIIFVINELRHKEPLIDLRLFARRNFGFGSVVNFALGMGLYGVIYILPVYLGQAQGYSAFQIGTVIIWLGLPQLVIIPFIPLLMKRFDPRKLIGFRHAFVWRQLLLHCLLQQRLFRPAASHPFAHPRSRPAIHHGPSLGSRNGGYGKRQGKRGSGLRLVQYATEPRRVVRDRRSFYLSFPP